MKPGIMLPLVLCLAAGAGCETKSPQAKEPAQAVRKNAKEKAMHIDDIPYVPFGLGQETDLGQVEIKLSFISAKSGAGRQEITLNGKGHVRLFFSRSFQDKAPKTLEGDCEPEHVLRLLDLMEGAGLFGLPDEVTGRDKGASQRVLEVRLPGRSKRIAVQESDVYTVEQMIGAVKLTAGQCVPEALNHRFFPNL